MTESREHPDELLVFHVNGTLDAEERAQVEAHLADCPRCREEVEFLRALRSSMQASAADAEPDDMAWPRLQRAIRKEKTGQRPRRWLPAALAASLLVIAVQAVMLIGERAPDSRYTLSGAGPQGVVLQLRFQPQATEAQIRDVLQRVDATLIDGPGALGVYRVRLAAATDAADLARRIAWLEQQTAVVSHVARE
ncbi:MAG TPA: hypothetical protein ENK12_03365 [Gammaproteobacteria bacterium]|nr:hypothetical protein [Gammaproteobacteria bacterium]